jgi:hypothetical protein
MENCYSFPAVYLGVLVLKYRIIAITKTENAGIHTVYIPGSLG